MMNATSANTMLVMALFAITLSSAYASSRSLADTLATSSLTPLPVLDVEGKVLRSGTTYYVIPATSGEGGGVALASLTKDPESCPQTIVQDEDEISQGLPLTFTPVNSKSGYTVRTFTDLNIKVSTDTTCEEGTVWKVNDYDDDVQQWFIGTGGVEGNPGPRTVRNWFKIWKYGSNYKFTYCPAVCKSCKVDCKDVGIYVDENGGRKLALVDKEADPFVVKFVKKT
ncbi:Kunitz trypsin inhibitor 5 [Linum perenne]